MPEPEGPKAARGEPGALRYVEDEVPGVRWVFSSERVEYATCVVTVRDADCHQPRAAIFIVAPQDRRTTDRVRKFAERVVAALAHKIQVLVVDLFPPNDLAPQGIHPAIWDQIEPGSFELPPGKPLTLAAYTSNRERAAYVDLVAVGDPMQDMPLFLSADSYVPVPLEETYQATWARFPEYCRTIVETGIIPDADD